MKTTAAALAAVLCLAGAARAGAPVAAETAQIRELRAGIRDGKVRIKKLALGQHQELVLIRERERSDLAMVKASAARGETLHAAILEVREKSRRDRLALRARGSEERGRLRRGVKNGRERIAALRQKK